MKKTAHALALLFLLLLPCYTSGIEPDDVVRGNFVS
jgi:hypothetical protein